MTDNSKWNAEDWKAHFDERAGIREFDGGLNRQMAEARAFGDTVELYMKKNAGTSRSNAVFALRRKMGVNP